MSRTHYSTLLYSFDTLSCREKAIRTAFKKEGYYYGIRRRKPPISPKN
jgi:hypothetical protein